MLSSTNNQQPIQRRHESRIQETDKESQLKVILLDNTEKKADPFSTDFDPATLAEESQFQALLIEESLLRDMDIVEKSREEL